MKALILGLLIIGTSSTYALEDCTVEISLNIKTVEIEVTMIRHMESSAINEYLLKTKTCQDTYLEIVESGKLKKEIGASSYPIKYIYSQAKFGELGERALSQLDELSASRNAEFSIKGNEDVEFKGLN